MAGENPFSHASTRVLAIASGIAALVLAATVQLFPYDVTYLQMTVADLCDRNACRIVHFMAHDRVSFGGSMIAIGVLYTWLAASPLRRSAARRRRCRRSLGLRVSKSEVSKICAGLDECSSTACTSPATAR